MKPSSMIVPCALVAFAIPMLVSGHARACGGCYHRPSETETTVVTGHRMVLSVSTTRTVLWDQIQYDGDPSEFAWVLPVKAGARIELSTDAWFETLDAATSVNVVSPPLDCDGAPGVSNGGGCGSTADEASGGFSPSKDGVTVLHQGTVGPYETVTLSTDTPGALNAWLADHGYGVDAGIQPVIDAYVAEGFDFIALRLQPGAGVRAMKPVRVVSPGASPTLPLRMVAAGTGPFVAITLFVIGEGRWATKNFPGTRIDVGQLSWDHLTTQSNYGALRAAALGEGEGRTWLTAFAKQGALLSPVPTRGGFGSVDYATDQGPVETIAEAYLAQARKNGEGSSCGAAFLAHADDAAVVIDPCPPGAEDPSACPAVMPGQIDARAFACGGADDLAVALTGMHPRDVWLTRLESQLPRAALAEDLELEAAADQASVDNWLTPSRVTGEKEACRAALDTQAASAPGVLRGGGGPPRGIPVALLAGGLALLGGAARRSRRPVALVLRAGR